jgi:hypothetical protein
MREKVFCGRSNTDLEIHPAPHPRDHFSSRARRDKQKKCASTSCGLQVFRSQVFNISSRLTPHASSPDFLLTPCSFLHSTFCLSSINHQ